MNYWKTDLPQLLFLHDFSLLNAVGKSLRVSWQNQRGCSSGVEHNLAKVGVEGSNPFTRSSLSQKTTAEIQGEVSCLTDSGRRWCFFTTGQSSSRNLHRSHYGHSEDDMATIRKRNGRWQAQIPKSGTRAISRTFTLRQDVREDELMQAR